MAMRGGCILPDRSPRRHARQVARDDELPGRRGDGSGGQTAGRHQGLNMGPKSGSAPGLAGLRSGDAVAHAGRHAGVVVHAPGAARRGPPHTARTPTGPPALQASGCAAPLSRPSNRSASVFLTTQLFVGDHGRRKQDPPVPAEETAGRKQVSALN